MQHNDEHTAACSEQLISPINAAFNMEAAVVEAHKSQSVVLAFVCATRCVSLMDAEGTSEVFQEMCNGPRARALWQSTCSSWCPQLRKQPYGQFRQPSERQPCELLCDGNAIGRADTLLRVPPPSGSN